MSRILKISVLVIFAINSISAYARTVVDEFDENKAIRLHIASYEFRKNKLGDPAPDGNVFLVIRGTLSNLNKEKRASIPPVDKAFTVRINGKTMLELDPLSEDTADPFWGPLVLFEGEQRPIEMVYVMPSQSPESVEIRHLSNMGSMSIYVVGQAPEITTTFLAGPLVVGLTELAVSSVVVIPEIEGQSAPQGWKWLQVDYLYTNLRELKPLETNIAGLSTLAEDGGYLYEPLSHAGKGDMVDIQKFYAGEPTPGQLIFQVPDQHGALELVHFTEAGAIRLHLTPDQPIRSLPEVIAGPALNGRIALSLFGIRTRPGGAGIVLDIGLSLNLEDPLADMPIDLSGAFELHDNKGFRKSDESVPGLTRPLRQVVIRRDQITRGEVAFPGARLASGQELVLPLASGHVRLKVPGKQSGQHAAVGQPDQPARVTTRKTTSKTSHKKPVKPSAGKRSTSPGRADSVTGIPKVLNTSLLDIRGRFIRLHAVEGEQGIYAENLSAYIRDREVSCTVVAKGTFRCLLGTVDLALVVLKNGAGKAGPNASQELLEAQANAREARLGVWQ